MAATINLSSLELALVAEFNLEMARAYDEVAEDAAGQPKTRRTARKLGSRQRERARLLQLEARRRRAESTITSEEVISEPGSAYTGPDRRKRERRVAERRASHAVGPDVKVAGHDRRTDPDRRRRERRRQDFALR